MTENYALNDGHIHEAIDRIHVAISYLQSTLAGHSLIGSVSEYEAQVQSAIKILSDLYQKIGQHEHVSEIAEIHAFKAGFTTTNS